MKTVCIIQSRLGSKRFPCKVLKKISNHSLLNWVIKRVKKSKKINEIILATTHLKEDDKLELVARSNNITIYRGSGNDVLKRFYNASKKIKPKFIVRVCADNPFVDSGMIDRLVTKFNYKKFDYAFNNQPKLSCKCADGFGAEIFKFALLRKLNKIVKSKYLREHVTLYLWKNIKKFKIQPIKCSKLLSEPNYRFDINTYSDYIKINKFVLDSNININTKASKIVSFYRNYLKKI